MKKLRTSVCTLLLTTLLTGNILANTSIVGSSPAVTDLVSAFVEGILLILRDGDCPPRLCTTCRPDGVITGSGNCRPPE